MVANKEETIHYICVSVNGRDRNNQHFVHEVSSIVMRLWHELVATKLIMQRTPTGDTKRLFDTGEKNLDKKK